jgi:hypothetical protein
MSPVKYELVEVSSSQYEEFQVLGCDTLLLL